MVDMAYMEHRCTGIFFILGAVGGSKVTLNLFGKVGTSATIDDAYLVLRLLFTYWNSEVNDLILPLLNQILCHRAIVLLGLAGRINYSVT